MFKPLSVFLGLRYVRSRHSNGFSSFISASSTLGIALGTMVLIIVLSAMNGFERELAQKLLSIVPHAELMSVNKPIENWPASIEWVESQENIISAAPVIKMTGMMQYKTQLKALEIRGVDPQLEIEVSDISRYIIKGDWQHLNQKKGIVIGSGVAKKLSVDIGDTVQILLPSQKINNNDINKVFEAPLKQNINIVGIFKFGGTIDESLAYISLAQASSIVGLLENQAQGIRLKVDDVFNASIIARSVAYKFNYYVYIHDWTRTQGHLFNDIQLVRMVMFIVLVLVIAVASFNIVSTLIMTVNEKKSDIAILLTMGAKPVTIMLTFVFQGLFNGILGCAIGGLSGVYLALNLSNIFSFLENLFSMTFLSSDVYFIDHLPSELHMNDVYITILTALCMSLIATIYPAWQAVNIKPAQVLGQM